MGDMLKRIRQAGITYEAQEVLNLMEAGNPDLPLLAAFLGNFTGCFFLNFGFFCSNLKWFPPVFLVLLCGGDRSIAETFMARCRVRLAGKKVRDGDRSCFS